VSGIPKEIPDLGSADERVRQNPRFDPTAAGAFTSEDYFVWSRIDGHTSIHDLILMTGFPPDHTVAILRRLRAVGALLRPNESPEAVADRLETARQAAALAGLALTEAEQTALGEAIDLDDTEKRRIVAMLRKVEGGDYFALLGVSETVDRRTLKKAYFKVSKEFHPDRHYGKNLGSFRERLARIFDTAHKAFEVLSDDGERAAYLARRSGRGGRARAASQTPQDHAAELFRRACSAEVSGDESAAAKLFAAAVRVDPKDRYLRRAASFSLKAERLEDAEEYAKKAVELRPNDPSYARLLADAYRAAGKLDRAELTLARALTLKNDNDHLRAELEAELAAVRTEKSRPGRPGTDS
jgi:curved DNA-binding protein CbpA